jgi:hypothetical protein
MLTWSHVQLEITETVRLTALARVKADLEPCSIRYYGDCYVDSSAMYEA